MSDDLNATCNIEAEMSVLGSLLIAPDKCMDDVFPMVRPAEFYHPAHRIIYEAIWQLAQNRRAIDLVTVKARLSDLGELQNIGGEDYLIQVAEAVPSAANAKHYAAIVRETRVNRDLAELARSIEESLSEDISSDERISRFQDALQRVADRGIAKSPSSVTEIMTRIVDHMDALLDGTAQVTKVWSGFYDLDRLTGGFKPGELVVVAARPSMGKTAFVCKMALSLARKTQPVGIFSLEMSEDELGKRLITTDHRINSQTFGKADAYQSWADGIDGVYGLPICIDDCADLDHVRLGAKARWMRRRLGQLSMVIVDYLQLMTPSAKSRTSDSRALEVGDTTKALKALSKDLECPVVVLSQLSRAVESREDKRPRLPDLRDSGSIEQDADYVIFLYRENYYLMREKSEEAVTEEDRVEVGEAIVAKNRNGPIGTAELAFIPQWAIWENLSR